ncbi:histidine decarboxylase [Paenalkalicoccus suaedae]|uniref:Histidine decarboxylase n=1 Tax=Paenalkalicoccus suaedae TaxID=2592382 RepID=A0A859FB72_9BACI|nr:pyridoxal-dependent decarboxylase [Paenalkalicoccus suaedae]QKS70042.1 histidine decarboxylase [Paenalkalicoccus suaedae]
MTTHKTKQSSSMFELGDGRMSEQDRHEILSDLAQEMQGKQQTFLGYQVNQELDYSAFAPFLNVHINNAGDPFTPGNMTMNSKEMEKAVLDYYADLWNAKTPHQNTTGDSYWGYTLSMGSTEGNVYGIWNARDYLGGKVLLSDPEAEEVALEASKDGGAKKAPVGVAYQQGEMENGNENAFRPIAFYSQDTHYSIVKAMRVLDFTTYYDQAVATGEECPLVYPDDFPTGFSSKYMGKSGWPLEVPSNDDGSIHIPSLAKLVTFFAERGHPIFVCFNYGTTFKGAYDDIESAVAALVPILKENGMYERAVTYETDDAVKTSTRTGYWFHVDGALGAAYMPYIEKAIDAGELELPEDFAYRPFDFRIPEVHSITCSFHKYAGLPFPSGIFMGKTKNQLLPPDDPMYIGSPDTTFAGSRNGLAGMMMWDFLAKHSEEDHIAQVVKNEEVAAYATLRLQKLEEELNSTLWVERSPLSLTLRFKRPSEKIIYKYSLSCEELYVDGAKRGYAHIFCMNHVTEDLIDQLVEDLRTPGAFPEQMKVERDEDAHDEHNVYSPTIGKSFK